MTATTLALSTSLASLTSHDLEMFAGFRIPDELLAAAGVQRWGDREARDRFRFTGSGDKSGIEYPYCGQDGVRRTSRFRFDVPPLVSGKPEGKYHSPYGDRKHLFFPPGFFETLAADPDVVIVAVESEKGCLAYSLG